MMRRLREDAIERNSKARTRALMNASPIRMGSLSSSSTTRKTSSCLRCLPFVTCLWMLLLYGAVHRMGHRDPDQKSGGLGKILRFEGFRRTAGVASTVSAGADGAAAAALAAKAGAGAGAGKRGKRGQVHSEMEEPDFQKREDDVIEIIRMTPGNQSDVLRDELEHLIHTSAPPRPITKPPPMWPINSTLTRGAKHPNILFILR